MYPKDGRHTNYTFATFKPVSGRAWRKSGQTRMSK